MLESSLFKPSDVAMLVPTYQEGRVIRQTLQTLIPLGYVVVLIDDGSTDDTQQQVADLPIHYLRHPVNLGQGAALQTGMRYATQLDVAFAIHFDADGQHREEDIPALLAPLRTGKADIVFGSRFLSSAGREALPFTRRHLLKVAAHVNWGLTGIRLSDAHCGLRALSRKAFSQIDLRQAKMAHATEILSETKRLNLRYCEVAVNVTYDDYSRGKGQSGWQALPILGDLLGAWLMRRR